MLKLRFSRVTQALLLTLGLLLAPSLAEATSAGEPSVETLRLFLNDPMIETAKNCRKGKPCGNSCIAQSKMCHK